MSDHEWNELAVGISIVLALILNFLVLSWRHLQNDKTRR